MLPFNRAKNLMQLCWVVPQLETSIDHWVRTGGAGPFFLFEALHFDDANYRGRAENIQPCRAAIGQLGDMQIELVEPLGEGPGLWSEFIPRGGFGLHHTGLYCEDYAAEREAFLAAGAEVAFEGLMMGAPTCYIDTTPTLGHMTELISANPIGAAVFAQFRAAAQGWDGCDPVRRLGGGPLRVNEEPA